MPGIWGKPTASVDWCEANYAHSQYVCELFNTLSSLPLVFVGLAGAYLHRRALGPSFSLVFLSVALVGAGSAAFHATLLFELQMLDELPMLFTATLLVYILLEHGATRRFERRLRIGLVAYAALATYGAAFTRGQVQFWLFQTSFALLEGFALYRTFLIYRASDSEPQRRLFRRGVSLYLGGILLWFLDLGFCGGIVGAARAFDLPSPELHAWWHVLAAGGLYSLILVIAYQRAQALGHGPRLARWGPMPQLQLEAET